MKSNHPPHGGNRDATARKTGLKKEELIDFSANINPLPLPGSVYDAVQKAMAELPHYPDMEYHALKELIGRCYDIDAERILLGNGSTELLYRFPSCMKEGKTCIVVPSYGDYTEAFARRDEVFFHHLKEKENFMLLLADLEQSINGCGRVVMGCPNNPTGKAFSQRELLSFVKAHPQTDFLIDEAFADFLPEEERGIFLKEHPENLVLLRSLTKFFGIPGARLGFAVASERIVKKMHALQEPWSINCFAEALATVLLPDKDFASETRKLVDTERKKMEKALSLFPSLRVYPSDVNFLLCKMRSGKLNAEELQKKLLPFGIMIRNCANFRGLDGSFFRLAVRGEKENILLSERLREVLP